MLFRSPLALPACADSRLRAAAEQALAAAQLGRGCGRGCGRAAGRGWGCAHGNQALLCQRQAASWEGVRAPTGGLPRPGAGKLPLAEASQGAGAEAALVAGRAQPGNQALPPLWQHLLVTGVQTLGPPGSLGDPPIARSSGSDRERPCRLVGSPEGDRALPLRSRALSVPMLRPRGLGRKGLAGPKAPWLLTGRPPLTSSQGCSSAAETQRDG